MQFLKTMANLSRTTITEDAAPAPSSVSFSRNPFAHSEESHAQECVASVEPRFRGWMTEMRGVASAREVPYRMTVGGGAKHTPRTPSRGGNFAGAPRHARCLLHCQF